MKSSEVYQDDHTFSPPQWSSFTPPLTAPLGRTVNFRVALLSGSPTDWTGPPDS
jgi:hypothetical protein